MQGLAIRAFGGVSGVVKIYFFVCGALILGGVLCSPMMVVAWILLAALF